MNKLVSGAIGEEVLLMPNQQKVFLPDVIDLRRKRIKHIDFCDASRMPKSPNNVDVINNAYIDLLFLTLTESNTQKELVQALHVSQLTNNGNRLFINKIIDLQRSYIDVSNVPAAALTGKCIYLVFWYDEPAVWGQTQEALRNEIQPFEITLTGSKTFFSENRDLLNKRYQNILVSFPGFTHTGKSGLNIANSTNKFLTLTRQNLQFFQRVPLFLFFQYYLAYKLRIQNVQFDFQTSFIETLTTTPDDLKTVFFNGIIDGGQTYKS